MLVLSRRQGESILIPDLDVKIKVLRVLGSRVQIGLEGPREVKITRGETVRRPPSRPRSPPLRPRK